MRVKCNPEQCVRCLLIHPFKCWKRIKIILQCVLTFSCDDPLIKKFAQFDYAHLVRNFAQEMFFPMFVSGKTKVFLVQNDWINVFMSQCFYVILYLCMFTTVRGSLVLPPCLCTEKTISWCRIKRLRHLLRFRILVVFFFGIIPYFGNNQFYIQYLHRFLFHALTQFSHCLTQEIAHGLIKPISYCWNMSSFWLVSAWKHIRIGVTVILIVFALQRLSWQRHYHKQDESFTQALNYSVASSRLDYIKQWWSIVFLPWTFIA